MKNKGLLPFNMSLYKDCGLLLPQQMKISKGNKSHFFTL